MNRREYELYRLELDQDLALRKVALGYSPELDSYALRPTEGSMLVVAPAGPALREWLTEDMEADAEDNLRFLYLNPAGGGDLVPHMPFERADLLRDLLCLDFASTACIADFAVTHGLPDGPDSRLCVEPPEGYHYASVAGTLDLFPDDESPGTTLHGPPVALWRMEYEAARMAVAVQLVAAVRERDAQLAQQVMGPLSTLDALSFPSGPCRSGSGPYFRSGPCWESDLRPADCPGPDACPKPDPRVGWRLSARHMFGPCSSRQCLLPEEYLVAATDWLACVVENNPYLAIKTVLAYPRPRQALVEAALGEVTLNLPIRFGESPPSYWLKRLRTRSASPDADTVPSRAPVIVFSRLVEGSLSAAWYQVLDLMVTYSELRRCKHCGTLFGATHGNQEYCPPPKPGALSPCRQAAKQARKRAARKTVTP